MLTLLNSVAPKDVLSVRYYDQRELANFELSVDMTMLELLLKYNCDIYIQGSKSRRWDSSHRKFINAFSGNLSGYYCEGKCRSSSDIIIINHNLGSSTGVYDFSNSGKPAQKTYKDNDGNTLARLDTDGNIWFCDFYHQETSSSITKFPEFYEILADAWGESDEINIEKLLSDSISPLDPSKIVRIESEFDKDTYIKEVEHRFREAVGLQGCIQNSKILSLTTVLASERMAREKTIQDSSATSFAQGVTFAKKNDGWEFKNGRLYWKKRIEMKHCNYYDRSWDLPKSEAGKYFIEGLNFVVSPKPTQAFAEKHHHPNASESNSICIGDLQGHILSDILEKLPSMLETGGLTHPFSSEKAWDIISIVVNKKGEFPDKTCKVNKKWNSSSRGMIAETIPTPDQVLKYLETRARGLAAGGTSREEPVASPPRARFRTMRPMPLLADDAIREGSVLTERDARAELENSRELAEDTIELEREAEAIIEEPARG